MFPFWPHDETQNATAILSNGLLTGLQDLVEDFGIPEFNDMDIPITGTPALGIPDAESTIGDVYATVNNQSLFDMLSASFAFPPEDQVGE